MGMYNEVYCECPKCGGRGYMQVSQYVLGFGDFHIEVPETLMELRESQLKDLKAEIMENNFVCGGKPFDEGCGYSFNPFTKEREYNKRELIDELFKY